MTTGKSTSHRPAPSSRSRDAAVSRVADSRAVPVTAGGAGGFATDSVNDSVTESVVQWLRQQTVVAADAQMAADSRLIRTGDIFFAYPGAQGDGRDFIDRAIENGASVILCEAIGLNWQPDWTVPYLPIVGLKALVGDIAALWYWFEGRQAISTIAVTGTNGKTSCTQWIAQALSLLQREPVAVAGTLGLGIYQRGQQGALTANANTTPDAVLLQRELATLAKSRTVPVALAIEASSIGLHQQRLAGQPVDVAVHTNLTHDHLDYHGDMAAYEAAKALLFERPELKAAVLNLDDEVGMRLAKKLAARASGPDFKLIGYSCNDATADGGLGDHVLRASAIRATATGTQFHLASAFGSGTVKTHVIGMFNVSNMLAVIGALLAAGYTLDQVLAVTARLKPVTGRMQPMGGDDAPLVVVDYAHTPDGLEQAIKTTRDISRQRHGKLWCVFGCGGDRDSAKRPAMGRIAAEGSDHIVLTNDNPRTETPAGILAQIQSGIPADKAQSVQVMEDRAAAIVWAIRHAERADVVLVAGKGHESWQETMGRRLPFLDADHVAIGLAARVTMKGSQHG